MLIREFPNKPWNHLRTLQTTMGFFLSVYYPGPVEEVEIAGPTGARTRLKTPELVDWALHAVDGKVHVCYQAGTGDTKRVYLLPTSIPCGTAAGAGVAGPAPAPGGTMTEDQLQAALRAVLTPALKGVADTQDAMWRDVVGRLKAHDEATVPSINTLALAMSALTPEQIILHPNAADHFGLDVRAQFATMLQESIAIMFSNQAFCQVLLETLFRAAAELKKYGFDVLAPPAE